MVQIYKKAKDSTVRRREYNKKFHHDQREARRKELVLSMGNKCVKCGKTAEEATLWFILKEGATRPPVALVKRIRYRDLTLAKQEAPLYDLYCISHYREKCRKIPPHGTKARYSGRNWRCRCELCRAAWNEYTKAWHKQKYKKRRAARELMKSDSFRKLFKNG